MLHEMRHIQDKRKTVLTLAVAESTSSDKEMPAKVPSALSLRDIHSHLQDWKGALTR